MDGEIIFNVCEEIFDEFKGDISNLADKIAVSMIQKMKENNISIRMKHDNSSTCSKDHFLLNSRITSRFKDHFDFSFLCSITKKDLREVMDE